MIETFMIVGDDFSGWMHLYASGMTRIEIRRAGGSLANVVRQFPNEEQAEQWLDDFEKFISEGSR